MADRPILFSAPMVRALLDGRKTQTRRILKDQPGELDKPFMMDDGSWHVTDSQGGHMSPLPVRFRVGDRLYVREHWRTHRDHDDIAPRALLDGSRTCIVSYVADGDSDEWLGRFRQGMHMPRWASRLTLTVTDVRVERLQNISEADAIAEGIERHYAGWMPYSTAFYEVDGVTPANFHRDPCESYRSLWGTINGTESWAANPWIAAVSFKPEIRNIDA